jgi:CBS domain-containing protein/PII-like signaling protein
MELDGKAKRVRIYIGQGEVAQLIRLLRSENAAGASVFHIAEGFGASGRIHDSGLVDVITQLAEVIEWIDVPERVDRLLPKIKQSIVPGLITVEDVDVVLHASPPMRRLGRGLTAGAVMSRDVATVTRETPVREVVELLLGKTYRALPVVDGELPIGIVTNGDLVAKGGLPLRVELLPALETPALHDALATLARERKTAADVMTPKPVTVRATALVAQVADVMAQRRLKRLPVVDERGALLGVISRLDLLRTVAEGFAAKDGPPRALGLSGDVAVARVMRREVPTVHPETQLPEVLQVVASTRLNRALVVDEARRVVGLISDAELLDRVTPSLRPRALRSLMHRLPFARPSEGEAAAERHATARRAAELMVTRVPTAREDAPLHEALVPMLRDREKLVAVVDREGRLVGVVDRADILRGLITIQ